MASKDIPHRDTQDLTDEPKAVPRDRDQSSISPERAHDKADEAEFPEAGGAVPPALGEGLTARDNLKDEPTPAESDASLRRLKP
jgi:hypothetical protein